jgi:WD40 repeat-containing protein SMU1
VVKSFQSGKREGGAFLASWVSPRGEFIYCLGEDSNIYCFGVASGKLEHLVQAFDAGAIGLCHHPHRNQLAVWCEEGLLKTFVAV